MLHSRPDYDRIQDPAGLIADDEPVFLIRAKDLAAVPTVRAYAQFAERVGAKMNIIDSARAWAVKMECWQQEHQLIVKVPDLPKEADELAID